MERLDRSVRQRVATALDTLSQDPHSGKLTTPKGAGKLTGRPESRLRVGDWRVLLELDPETRTVIVKRVLPRGRAYDR